MAEVEPLVKRTKLKGKTYRIIPSNFPPITIFEDCSDPDDLLLLYELESRNNPRIRQEVGEISIVPQKDRVSGPGTTPIMASFTHIGKEARLNDASYGVYYAGMEMETAIRETVYWNEKMLADTNEPAQERTMRAYIAKINPKYCEFVDMRHDDLFHHPDDYSYPQRVTKELRDQDEYGVVYNSVRNKGGTCVGVLRPTALLPATQSTHFMYYWNGREIAHVTEISEVKLI